MTFVGATDAVNDDGVICEHGLVERLKNNDESVLQSLFSFLEPRTKGQIRRRWALSEEDAEDALAMARYRLWSSRHEYDPARASLRTWHWAILSNCVIDLLRREPLRSVTRSIGSELDTLLPPGDTQPNCSSPSRAEEAVREIVDKLKRVDRDIIQHYAETFENRSWAPVLAKKLAMTLDAARMRCMRVRQKIKQEMRRRGFRFSRNVLLAEDSRDNRRFMSAVLKKAGMSVTEAVDGTSAVEAAMTLFSKGNLFDLILMDIRMPQLDGYEATRQLRDQDYPGRIVAVTVNGSSDNHSNWIERGRCMEAGCNDYIAKPVTAEQLVKLVAR